MRMSALILTVVAAALLTTPASPQDKVNLSRKEQIQKSAKKVKDLRKERLAVLQELTAQLDRLYRNARVSVDELLEAMLQLSQAELEAAETEVQRIAVSKNLVDVLKQYERMAEARLKSGRGTMAALLKVRAKRLEAEIHLEQAKVKLPALEHHKIVVSSPKAKDVIITQQYVCQIHSQRHIKVRSLQSGYLEAVPVKEGQAVKRGDVLFKVMPILYRARLDAELAEVKLAELKLKNVERMFKNKVVSQNEVALYKAKLAKAQAKAKLAEAELNFTTVRAPFDGIIDRLHEQQGSLVTEGNILTTLSDNRVMWVYFNVPEHRYLEYLGRQGKRKPASRLELVDSRIELKLADGSTFNKEKTSKDPGNIVTVEGQFNNETGNIAFRADFPNPDRLLRHGMTGKLLIHQTLKNAIVVPERAIFKIRDSQYVYVIDKNDVAHRRVSPSSTNWRTSV